MGGEVRSQSGGADEAGERRAYHHGSLREAMLQASERILEREGIIGLTLRAAAREAGASHAAPKNHFGDLAGLLSELAAVGFRRFHEQLALAAKDAATPQERLLKIGRSYVEFGRQNPGLFQLMFRSERLDMGRPNLREAASAAFTQLEEAVDAKEPGHKQDDFNLVKAGNVVRAWSLVHGFTTLMLDHRLSRVLEALPAKTTLDDLLAEVIGGSRGPGRAKD